MNLSKLQEKVESRRAWRAAVCGLQRAGHNWTTEQQKQYMVTKTEWTLGDFYHCLKILWASLVVQLVKNVPAMQEAWVQSLGQEDPLEKETATHSSTLAWGIPWTEELGRLQSGITKSPIGLYD